MKIGSIIFLEQEIFLVKREELPFPLWFTHHHRKSYGSNSSPRKQVRGDQITRKETATPAHSEWPARECSWKAASSLTPFPMYSLSWKCRDPRQNMPLAMSTEDASPAGPCRPMTPTRDEPTTLLPSVKIKPKNAIFYGPQRHLKITEVGTSDLRFTLESFPHCTYPQKCLFSKWNWSLTCGCAPNSKIKIFPAWSIIIKLSFLISLSQSI